MAQNETHHADQQLHGRELPGQTAFVQWASRHEPEVDDGHVGAFHKQLPAALILAVDDLEQADLAQQTHDGRYKEGAGLSLAGPDDHAGLEDVLEGIVPGQSVARAGDDVEQLGRRVDKVEDLGQQEEDERLAKVALDADDDKDHAGKVAVGVADKDVGGVLVVGKEGQADAEEGQEEEETEQVAVDGRVRVRRDKVQTVVGDEE